MAKFARRQLEGVLLKQTTVVKVLFDALKQTLFPAKFESPQKVSIKIFSVEKSLSSENHFYFRGYLPQIYFIL